MAHFVGISNDGGRLYREIAEVTGRLRKREIDINDMDRNVTVQATWIASAEYRWNEGVVEICLSPALMPYLLDLKNNFTKITLKYAISLKSVHAIRIYELLKQYAGLGGRTIPISELRQFCGIRPDDYKFFKDLRVWVVDVAQREINGKTDIAFTYETVKEARKVVALRFIITANRPAEPADEVRDDPKLSRLVSRLLAYGMAEDIARSLVAESEPELVEWAVADLARRLKTKEKIDNPAGWLRTAIREDWRPQQSLFDNERETARSSARTQEARREALEKEVSAIQKTYSAYVTKALTDYLDRLDDAAWNALEADFRAHLEATWPFFVASFNGRSAMTTNPAIRVKALQYLSANRSDFQVERLAEFARAAGMLDFESKEGELRSLSR